MLLTDGMLERNASEIDVADALGRTGDLHPREVVHTLGAAVVEAAGGNLRDDSTVVCLDWCGGPPRLRTSTGGASLTLNVRHATRPWRRFSHCAIDSRHDQVAGRRTEERRTE